MRLLLLALRRRMRAHRRNAPRPAAAHRCRVPAHTRRQPPAARRWRRGGATARSRSAGAAAAARRAAPACRRSRPRGSLAPLTQSDAHAPRQRRRRLAAERAPDVQAPALLLVAASRGTAAAAPQRSTRSRGAKSRCHRPGDPPADGTDALTREQSPAARAARSSARISSLAASFSGVAPSCAAYIARSVSTIDAAKQRDRSARARLVTHAAVRAAFQQRCHAGGVAERSRVLQRGAALLRGGRAPGRMR
jgi:hypothetical protein